MQTVWARTKITDCALLIAAERWTMSVNSAGRCSWYALPSLPPGPSILAHAPIYLPLFALLSCISRLIEMLCYQVLHRDLKPQNVLIDRGLSVCQGWCGLSGLGL